MQKKETFWRIRREAKAYFSLLRKSNQKQVKLLIFAQGRTGSTLLENLLASTGHFHESGEVLGANNERVRYPIAFVKGLAKQRAPKNFQCHVKIYHLNEDRIAHGAKAVEPKKFLRSLHKSGWKIIYLQRLNKFEHYVSGCLAKARGGYHKFDNEEEAIHLEIDKVDLKRGIENRYRLDGCEKSALESVPHLHLKYEEDLLSSEKQNKTIDRVLAYLGLDQRSAVTKMKKINSKNKTLTIGNYEEALNWGSEIVKKVESNNVS